MHILKPIVHQTIWGSNILTKYYGETSIGHLYSCITENSSSNIILNGFFKNKTICDLFNKYGYSSFNFNVAIVTPSESLSIQVHPELGEGKKKESWIFLKAPMDGYIYCGCLEKSIAKFEKKVLDGRVQDCIEQFSVSAGDYVQIDGGLVHALTPNCIVYEIEERNGKTCRFYDYDRVDSNGKKRQLHMKEGLSHLDILKKPKYIHAWNGDQIIESSYVLNRINCNKSQLYNPYDNKLICATLIRGQCTIENVQLLPGMSIILEPFEKLLIPSTEWIVASNYN